MSMLFTATYIHDMMMTVQEKSHARLFQETGGEGWGGVEAAHPCLLLFKNAARKTGPCGFSSGKSVQSSVCGLLLSGFPGFCR